MDLAHLKAQWVAVLDNLERDDRIAWLALFDARLAALEDDVLILDFSDADKLAGGHDMRRLLPVDRVSSLENAIRNVVGVDIRCRISPPPGS
jgi:hypothetical protein